MENNREKKIGWIFLCILFLFSLYYIIYSNVRMIELPHLTWFDQMELAELYFEGDLELYDLFSTYGEHGMLANNIIFLINIALFHGTTMFDVVINDINVIVCASILMSYTLKTLKKRNNIVVFLIMEGIFLFSSTQASSGAMETQVRLGLLFFLIAMLAVDRELRNKEIKVKGLVLGTVLILLSINVFGTLYSFAGVPLIWGICLFYFIKREKSVNHRKNALISGLYFLTIPLYLVEYRLLWNGTLSQMGTENGTSFNLVEIIKCLFAWCANGVLGWAYHESLDYKSITFLVVGAIVFLIVLLSVMLFMKARMYEKTWLPLMCITYSFGVFVMIIIGRAPGWDWMANEWYNVHIKIALASSVWIYGYVFQISQKRIVWIILPMILFGCSVVGNVYEIKRAPYVRQYYEEKQKYLFVEDKLDMPVDINGQTPLLHSLDKTMDSLDILRKYNLSVFRYWDVYEAYQEVMSKFSKVIYLDGHYEDGWVENEISFIYNSENSTQIDITYHSLEKQTLKIWVNGEFKQTNEITKGTGKISVEIESGKSSHILITSDYYEQLSFPDDRYASYIISDIIGK